MKSKDSRNKSPASASKVSAIKARATKSLLINPNDLEPLVTLPPDGGWGWVIVAASFFSMFCLDGVGYCFAVFFEDISNDMHCQFTEVALTSSILGGFYFLAGPLTCSAINRIGFQIIAVIGGVLGVLAFMLASFMKSILPFTILIGVVGGMAFNLIYTPSVIAIGFYFERWRALAMAVTCCGSSLGVMGIPLLMSKVFGKYNWRTKFKILSGAFGVCGLLGLTYKPLKSTRVEKNVQFGEVSTVQSMATIMDSESEVEETGGLAGIFQRFRNALFPTISEYSAESSRYGSAAPSRTSSVYYLQRKCMLHCPIFGKCLKWCHCIRRKSEESVSNINRPMYRDDIFYTGSINLLSRQQSRNPESRTSRLTQLRGEPSLAYTISVTRAPTQRDILEENQCVLFPEACIRVLTTMLHFQMLKSPTFILLLISGYLSLVGTYICYTYVSERALAMGIDKGSATMLLSILGIANTVGRALCGVASCFSADINIISWVSLEICGLATIISIFFPTNIAQIFFCCTFGITIATFSVFRPIMFVELFGIENLTNCFGLNMVFQSAAAFSAIPLANYLYSSTKSFSATFMFTGAAILLSGILLIPVRCILRWEERHKDKRVTFS